MKSFSTSRISVLFLSLYVNGLAWSSPPEVLDIPLEIEPTRLETADINGGRITDIVVSGFGLPLTSIAGLEPPGTAC
jgi:hypothetical protein